MSLENLDKILDREKRVRRRQLWFTAGFVAAVVVVLGALFTM